MADGGHELVEQLHQPGAEQGGERGPARSSLQSRISRLEGYHTSSSSGSSSSSSTLTNTSIGYSPTGSGPVGNIDSAKSPYVWIGEQSIKSALGNSSAAVRNVTFLINGSSIGTTSVSVSGAMSCFVLKYTMSKGAVLSARVVYSPSSSSGTTYTVTTNTYTYNG